MWTNCTAWPIYGVTVKINRYQLPLKSNRIRSCWQFHFCFGFKQNSNCFQKMGKCWARSYSGERRQRKKDVSTRRLTGCPAMSHAFLRLIVSIFLFLSFFLIGFYFSHFFYYYWFSFSSISLVSFGVNLYTQNMHAVLHGSQKLMIIISVRIYPIATYNFF